MQKEFHLRVRAVVRDGDKIENIKNMSNKIEDIFKKVGAMEKVEEGINSGKQEKQLTLQEELDILEEETQISRKQIIDIEKSIAEDKFRLNEIREKLNLPFNDSDKDMPSETINKEKLEQLKIENQKKWYEKARIKAESFISGIDPDLKVEVEFVDVTPDDGSDKYETVALKFKHVSNPDINWTMEIDANKEYIENELEGIVKKIYNERTSKESNKRSQK